MKLPSEQETTVADVLAGSSAAGGLAGSPSLVYQAAQRLSGCNNVATCGAVNRAVHAVYGSCAPFGLERQNVPIKMPKVDGSGFVKYGTCSRALPIRRCRWISH